MRSTSPGRRHEVRRSVARCARGKQHEAQVMLGKSSMQREHEAWVGRTRHEAAGLARRRGRQVHPVQPDERSTEGITVFFTSNLQWNPIFKFKL